MKFEVKTPVKKIYFKFNVLVLGFLFILTIQLFESLNFLAIKILVLVTQHLLQLVLNMINIVNKCRYR